jgi:hypothetical protein
MCIVGLSSISRIKTLERWDWYNINIALRQLSRKSYILPKSRQCIGARINCSCRYQNGNTRRSARQGSIGVQQSRNIRLQHQKCRSDGHRDPLVVRVSIEGCAPLRRSARPETCYCTSNDPVEFVLPRPFQRQSFLHASPATLSRQAAHLLQASAVGPVANSGAGRTRDYAGPSFTLCEPAEIQNRMRTTGSARISSKHPRSRIPCAATAWLRTPGSCAVPCGRIESRRSAACSS